MIVETDNVMIIMQSVRMSTFWNGSKKIKYKSISATRTELWQKNLKIICENDKHVFTLYYGSRIYAISVFIIDH